MKPFYSLALLFCSLIFASNLNADTKSYSYSGSISMGQTKSHQIVIPYSGSFVMRLSVNPTGSTLTALIMRGGTAIMGTGTSTSTTTQAVAVSAGDVLTLQVSPAYISSGSVVYSVGGTLTYTANSAPVISSISANPTSTAYGNPVTVSVSATDVDGNLSYVRFTKGSSSVNDTTSPYAQTYSGLAIGTHTVTAYAVDTNAASDDASVSFSITGRSIALRAKSGVSRNGTTPTGQGVELISGTLASGHSLQSLGFSETPTITSSTAKGSYTINVAGSATGYSVTRTSGSWYVTDALNPTTTDTDGDHLPNWLESSLSSAGFSTASIKNSSSAVVPGSLCPPNSGAVYLCPGQPLE